MYNLNPHNKDNVILALEKVNINREILSCYRHERVVEDIALYSQQLLLTTEGGNDREEMYKQFIAMFEPHGVIDIAFKTNTNL